jgi:hypothetical protein
MHYRAVFVLIRLGSEPRLAKVEAAESRLAVADVEYRDAGYGNMLGFYDWLRGPSGELRGVRCWDDLGEDEALSQALERLPYVRRCAGVNFQILFHGDWGDLDETKGDDQGFLMAKPYVAMDGAFAILFGTEDLSEVDLAGIQE